jgi:tetratricopeptide (TPR) repeat protein
LKLLILIFLFIPTIHASEKLVKLYLDANRQYLDGNYSESIKQYKKILEQTTSSGEVYFNLGNAYFRNEKLGHSIYYFRKALELQPRDGDILYNLNYAKKKVIDWIPEKSKITMAYKLPLNKKESLYVLLILSLFFWISASLYLFKKVETLKWSRNLSFLFLVISIFTFLQLSVFQERFGVMTSKNVKVYSGTGKDNVLLFTLHEGTEFNVKDTTENWIKIELSDKKKGWVHKDHTII